MEQEIKKRKTKKTGWTPEHITCLIIIVGCLILRALGYDSLIEDILKMASAFYFGLNLPTPRK